MTLQQAGLAHVIPIMHIPPVTDESIARARAQQQRDRASTGLRFTEDGRIIPHQVAIVHPVAVYAHRSVIQGLVALEHEVAYVESVNEALALHALLASLYQHVDQIERLAIRRADALIGGQ